jgi:hypothetical protein
MVSWQGDIGVNVAYAKLAPVNVGTDAGITPTAKSFVVVGLVIWNRGDKDYAYQHPAYADSRTSEYALYDELGNEFAPENGAMQFNIVGEQRQALVKPQGNITDLLVFSADKKGLGQQLILRLHGPRFNGTDEQVISFKLAQNTMATR